MPRHPTHFATHEPFLALDCTKRPMTDSRYKSHFILGKQNRMNCELTHPARKQHAKRIGHFCFSSPQITPFLGGLSINRPGCCFQFQIPTKNLWWHFQAEPQYSQRFRGSYAGFRAYQAFLKLRCHLKKGSWKTSFFFKRLPGRCHVCFRECINSRCYLDKSIILIYMLYVL